MAWWDKALSAAKSAVNKVTEAVKKVTKSVVKTISEKVNKIKESMRKASSSVKREISKKIKNVKEKTEKVKKEIDKIIIKEVSIKNIEAGAKIDKVMKSIEKEAEMKVEIASQKLIDIEEGYIEEAEKKVVEDVEKPTTPFMKTWGELKKSIDEGNWLDVAKNVFSLMSASVLPEDVKVYAGSVPIGPAGVGLASKVITAKLGSKGFVSLFKTKIDDAVNMFRDLNVDDQAKMLRGLVKTDEGVGIVNKLLSFKALDKTLVKPTISIVNKKLQDKILIGSGFGALLSKAAKPKTIIFGLTGILGAIGSAYGIAFGTEWFAKEGLWELYDFPLGDRMRDYRFEPTAEKAARIQKDIDKLTEVMPKAKSLVENVAWLWPFTKEAWLTWADGIEFELEQRKEEFAKIIVPELIELPEEVEVMVRDVIDGDTIDVNLKGTDQGIEWTLPEYKETTHARIRVVGIDAPEKSPKGDIICSDVEIISVEKEWADNSTDKLKSLRDKKVILEIDPGNAMDAYGRILAVVRRNGEDIGLNQIKEGLACRRFYETNVKVDEDLYKKETLKAKEEGVGMWKGLEDIEKEEDKIKIKIKTTPKNARLFLDDVSLHHNSPSDEVELSDVIHLFTPGPHLLSAEKGGLSAMKDIEIVKGDNGEIELILETAPIEAEAEVVEEPVIEEPVIEEPVEEPPVVAKIEYTTEQEWAMKEAFTKIWEVEKGLFKSSRLTRDGVISTFMGYADEIQLVLLPLWTDWEILTTGNLDISEAEFKDLLSKHQIEMVV